MKLVVAAVRPTPILWWRASGLASPTEVPASTLPARGIAPVRARIASSSVVLPLWNGPTSAMHRGPGARVPFCAIFRLPYRARCGLLRDRFGHRFRLERDWQEESASRERGRNRSARTLVRRRKRPPEGGRFI